MSTGTMAKCPLPPRSSVHPRLVDDSQVVAHSRALRARGTSSTSRAALRWSGATVTTGMLAAVLAAPAMAADTPDQTGDGATVTGKFGVEQSWAEVRTTAEGSSADLTKDPAAASRARLRVPIEIRPCVVEAEVAANGSRTITTQSPIYMPMQEGTYTTSSFYGYRIHPVLGYSKLHEGDDFAAPEGTPIYAVADGVVVETQWDSSTGYRVGIKHTLADGTEYSSYYLHQWQEDVLVSVGEEVKAGQHIGSVGNAGLSTGAHLHFEIHDSSDTPIAPSLWLAEHGAVFLGEGC